MSCRGLLVVVALAPWLPGAPPETTPPMTVHNYPGVHLTISIPTDWVEIPTAELDRMSANVRQAAPQAKPQPYNYGFQASAESPYPRVLVQVKTSGRWAEKVFADMQKLPTLMKGEIEKNIQSASPDFAALNLKLGSLTYDPARQIAWLRMQFADEGGRTVQGLSGLHPTQVGSIQVHCYALAGDLDRYAPLFSDIVTSVQVDDEWKYRTTSGLSAFFGSPEDLGSRAVSGAIGGLAAFLLMQLWRRRKRPQTPQS